MTCETQTRDIPPLTDGSRLKLLVITMLYEPDCVGIAAIASDMCAALAARGHDVTVYTTYPYYPEWKRKSQVSSWRIQREVIQDVDVRRYGLFVPSNPSRLWPRLLHEVSFPVSLLRSLTDRRQFDVVMAYCPLLGTVLFSALRKLFYRQPALVEHPGHSGGSSHRQSNHPLEDDWPRGLAVAEVVVELGRCVEQYLTTDGATTGTNQVRPHACASVSELADTIPAERSAETARRKLAADQNILRGCFTVARSARSRGSWISAGN